MEILKTKDAADRLSVSQTTIKRWVTHFPSYFKKDRFGHYIFSEQEINLLTHIKDRIEHGETLDGINLTTNKLPQEPLQNKPSLHTNDNSIEDMVSRMDHIERSLNHKADEVVSIQLLQQREELEDLRQMIQQLAASLETIQKPNSRTHLSNEEIHLVAAGKLQVPPRKRSGLLRSFFSFL
ncbi:MAG: MerR family transcriptional regulator [Paenibacillus sp.]|nr:MerR family transcriptional regulator [Paenibacillus sp.]